MTSRIIKLTLTDRQMAAVMASVHAALASEVGGDFDAATIAALREAEPKLDAAWEARS